MFFLSLLPLWCITSWGQDRSFPEKGLRYRAAEILGTGKVREVPNPLCIGMSPSEILSEQSSPTYGVFAAEEGGGFVILSTRACLPEVLAYSREGTFSYGDMNPSLLWWLSHIREGARLLEGNGSAGVRAGSHFGESAGVVPQDGGERLLATASWGQGTPFNDKCPVVSGGKRAVTGCTATAFAILLRYFSHPSRGSGYSGEYKYGETTVPPQSLGHEYLWSRMPLDYSNYTPDEASAVSTLMLDLAYLVESSFGATSTTGYFNCFDEVVSHMGYARSSLLLNRYSLEEGEWLRRLRSSIGEGVPVMYSGRNPKDEGHAFILDGYDGDGRFHINWGWDGSGNGFFAFPDFGEYTGEHAALLGFVPDTGSPAGAYLGYGEGGEGLGILSSTDGRSIRRGVPFTLSTGRISNYAAVPFTGTISFALLHDGGAESGAVVSELLGTALPVVDLLPGWGFASVKRSCTISSDIAHGDYLALVYRGEGDTDWKVVSAAEDCGYVSRIPVYCEDVGDFTSMTYSAPRKQLGFQSRPGTRYEFTRGGEVLLSGTIREGTAKVDVSSLVGGGECTLELRWEDLVASLKIKL